MRGPLAVLALFLAAACSAPVAAQPDQCLRARLFQECLARIPTGPSHVVSNDWAEVVSECESAAYYQSHRHPAGIAPECSFDAPPRALAPKEQR